MVSSEQVNECGHFPSPCLFLYFSFFFFFFFLLFSPFPLVLLGGKKASSERWIEVKRANE